MAITAEAPTIRALLDPPPWKKDLVSTAHNPHDEVLTSLPLFKDPATLLYIFEACWLMAVVLEDPLRPRVRHRPNAAMAYPPKWPEVDREVTAKMMF